MKETLFRIPPSDEEMDLYYLRGRYYSQELHRFISRDSIGFAAGGARLTVPPRARDCSLRLA